jgi:hypothetical protein
MIERLRAKIEELQAGTDKDSPLTAKTVAATVGAAAAQAGLAAPSAPAPKKPASKAARNKLPKAAKPTRAKAVPYPSFETWRKYYPAGMMGMPGSAMMGAMPGSGPTAMGVIGMPGPSAGAPSAQSSEAAATAWALQYAATGGMSDHGAVPALLGIPQFAPAGMQRHPPTNPSEQGGSTTDAQDFASTYPQIDI